MGVERELGLNSKREIEEYGLAEFARRCREKVAWSAQELIRGSKRLGQWMDWGNDYYTFSDTNISYIWRFLKLVHERHGSSYRGHRSTEWCPAAEPPFRARAGWELRGAHRSFALRPLAPPRPARPVAYGLDDHALDAARERRRRGSSGRGVRPPGGRGALRLRKPRRGLRRAPARIELIGWRYEGPFDQLPGAEGVEHRVIPWGEVSMEREPGSSTFCAARRISSSRAYTTSVVMPVDEAGRFMTVSAGCTARRRNQPEQISADLAERPAGRGGRVRPPLSAGAATRPSFSALPTTGSLRSTKWRPRLLEANATVEWTPAYFGKRMDDWLRNMGDWNISAAASAPPPHLPVRMRPRHRGRFSRRARGEPRRPGSRSRAPPPMD